MATAARKKVAPVEAPETKTEPKESVKQARKERQKHELTAEQAAIVEFLDGPSNRIRFLTDEGLTRSQIRDTIPNAKGEPLLYQHVRNVQEQDKNMSAQKRKEFEALVAAAMKEAGIKVRKDHK